jgi:diguanylate cyclase (GGDEF)-like protein/PAS domain S-box-containing protein
MGDRLRVLILEDRPSDAELVADVLRQSGLKFDWKRVDRKKDYLAAIEDQPDIVLADYKVPGFGALDALDATREMGSDVPVIIITGSLGDEIAAECIQRGAADYLLKDRLSRLGTAVEKALERRRLREEARQTEGALRESEVKFRELIEQASDGIFVSGEQGGFRLANSRLCEMLGYGEQELLRLNVADTYVEAERAVLAQRLASLGEAGSRRFERLMKRKDGSVFPVEVSVRRLSSGLNQGIVRDITERKEATQALIESELRFRQMAENTRDVFFLIDLKTGSILYVSPAYEQIWGRSCESLIARPSSWAETIHPEDRQRIGQKFIEQQSSGQFDAEYRIVRPEGEVRWIHARTYSIRDEAGNPYRSVGTAEDITGQKQAEIKIKGLNRVHAVLSGINALIVRAKSREELFSDACQIAVEDGRFLMVGIGLVDKDARRVRIVASAGAVNGFFEQAPLALGQSVDSHEGLAPRAVRQREPVVSNDIQNDPQSIMIEACRERGIHSVAFLPLSVDSEAVGVLGLYAGEPGFFDAEEMKLLQELAGDISFALDHIEKSNRLDYLAYYDSVTGLANRKLLLERTDQRIQIAAEQKSRLAFAILDIERFKNVNDTLGRHVGDEILRTLAERLVKFHGDPDRIGRVLGDQFGIIISDARSEGEVARRVERKLSECIGAPVSAGGSELRISAKAGIALYPDDGADADTLFKNAEAALKRGKGAGERYLFYAQEMTERVGERLTLENQLRQALENEEFVLHYQPKVDTATRKIGGVEALIRWRSRERGLVPPMHFIPLLEETGLILEVGAWAMHRAALDYRRWSEQGLNAPRIAVNVSSIQLRRRDFVESVRNALGGSTGIDLEITESLIMEDIQASTQKLEAVRLLGARIAIDDFGTGYSSLAYLARLPVQELKIDRSFIITMLKDPAVMTLVSTLISMAHAMGLKVVAEGVDEEGQAKELKRLGCDQMQGYLFSKPVDFDAITALLAKRKEAKT